MIVFLKQFFISFGFIFLTACVTTAHFESKTYKPQKKAVISYLSDMSLFGALEKRERDARQKMRDFCFPEKPNLISEKIVKRLKGHYSQTSYDSRQHSDAIYREGVSYGGHALFGHQNQGSSSSGSSSTWSQPVLDSYTVIHFECK